MHRLPEGYLSSRSARLYETTTAWLYQAGMGSYVVWRLARAIAASGAASVLELGCGPGHFLAALSRQAPATRVAALELSPFMLELAGRRAPGARLVHADIAGFELGEAFDAVVAVHVFGHVPRPWALRALERARGHLAPGGRLHVLEHAWHRLPSPPMGLRLANSERFLGGLLLHRTFESTIE